MASRVRTGQVRVEFLANREEILKLLEKGYTLTYVYETLKEAGKLTISYPSLTYALRKYTEALKYEIDYRNSYKAALSYKEKLQQLEEENALKEKQLNEMSDLKAKEEKEAKEAKTEKLEKEASKQDNTKIIRQPQNTFGKGKTKSLEEMFGKDE